MLGEGQPEDDPLVEEHLVVDPGEVTYYDDESPLDDVDARMEIEDGELPLRELEENFIEEAKEEEI